MKEWYEKFQRLRCLCIAKLPGPSGPSEEKVESVGGGSSNQPPIGSLTGQVESWVAQSIP